MKKFLGDLRCVHLNLSVANNQARMTEYKGIDKILPLLTSPNVEIQRWTANALGIVCKDNGNKMVDLDFFF